MISLNALSRALRLKSFSDARRGASAVEFALIAPILILLYMGLAELTLGMMASRRVDHVTAAVGDLAAQTLTLSEANIEDIFTIADSIMQPFDTGDLLDIRLTSVKRNNKGQTEVVWSRGWQPYAAKQVLPDIDTSGIDIDQGLVLTDVNYRYTSAVGTFLPGLTEFKKSYQHNPRDKSAVVEIK